MPRRARSDDHTRPRHADPAGERDAHRLSAQFRTQRGEASAGAGEANRARASARGANLASPALSDTVSRSSTAGQASLEYVAVIALVTLLLVFAGPAVGAPDIPRKVVWGVRLGICFVANDYCRPIDAAVEGLSPCVLDRETQGKDPKLEVAFVQFGARFEWSIASASDGRFLITYTNGGSAGAGAGVGLELGPLTVDAVEGSATLRLQKSTAWSFDDAASAKRFIAGLPGSRNDHDAYPPLWTSSESDEELAGSLAKLTVGAYEAAGVQAAARAADGVRFGPGNEVTVYRALTLDGPDAEAFGSTAAGLGSRKIMAEVLFVAGKPRQLALRRIEPSDNGNRMTETVKRLDLRLPGNLMAAEPFVGLNGHVPPVHAVHDVLAWMDGEGTTERAGYSLNDSSHTVGLDFKLGAEFGASHTWTKVSQVLREAEAQAPGGPMRERFDCVGALR
jgi:hypothetical protein